jgi:hypothetical protein
VPPKLPRARAAALIESVADAAAAASVTPDRAISGADTEQRAACAAHASESKSSGVDRERLLTQLRRRVSHPTGRSAVQPPSSERPVPPKLPRAREAALIESVADAAAAVSVTPDRAISGADTEQRAACAAHASESKSSGVDRERLLTQLRRRVSHPTGRSAVQTPSSERPVPPKLPRARATALTESVC